jgi:hypothetical protein
MSANVSGERAWGPGGGGVFEMSIAEYERPVRWGVGLGDGCCPTACKVEHRRTASIEPSCLTFISLAIKP